MKVYKVYIFSEEEEEEEVHVRMYDKSVSGCMKVYKCMKVYESDTFIHSTLYTFILKLI